MLYIARTMLSLSCLFVCMSVTRQYYVETAQRIIRLFSPPSSHTILVFALPNVMAIFRLGPPDGGGKCKGIWKDCDFRPMSRYISKTVSTMVLWHANMKPYPRFWMVPWPRVTLKYLMTRSIARGDSWVSCQVIVRTHTHTCTCSL